MQERVKTFMWIGTCTLASLFGLPHPVILRALSPHPGLPFGTYTQELSAYEETVGSSKFGLIYPVLCSDS